MKHPDEFDAFYKDARTRLLLQTYALTGDLAASRGAVRDSFVAAWHQWRKVSRLEDPEAWLRPRAWRHAQRRHTARLWHRDKGLDPDVRATLDALGKLPMIQRRVLLLTHLTPVSMGEMAQEVGLPLAEAERLLQVATAQFSVQRDVPSTSIRALFDPLLGHVQNAPWPRPTIIRRAGAARRRTHTLVGAAAAVLALVASGVLVTDTNGVHATLARDHAATDRARTASEPRVVVPPPEFSGDALLTPAQVAKAVPSARWRAPQTSDNTAGDGLVVPCQRDRYADPKGSAALVRSFDSRPRKGAPRVSAVQLTELSGSTGSSARAYRTTLGWYAGCTEERVQLLSTRRVDQVGDEAMLLVLRSWQEPVATMVVGVARTGQMTTTTMTRATGSRFPDLGRNARLLGAAVAGLCTLPDSGACTGKPKMRVVPPLPTGVVPGLLSEIDLPPVPGVRKPWIGTEPRKAMLNVAATRCDHANFNAAPITNNLTRSFVIPLSRLPAQFGITETVATMPTRRARAFVAQVRTRMAGCHDKDLGTTVEQVSHLASGSREMTVWHVRTEISDQKSVDYLMGIMRAGTAVAQVGFVPDGNVGIGSGAFVALVDRALARLPAMPPPRRG